MIILQTNLFGIILLHILLKILIKPTHLNFHNLIINEIPCDHDHEATQLQPAELLPADRQLEGPDDQRTGHVHHGAGQGVDFLSYDYSEHVEGADGKHGAQHGHD